METPVELNPAQRDVLDQLGASPDERPRFDAVLRHELRRALDDALAPLVDLLDHRTDAKPGDNMFVSKHQLGRVMGCERRFLAEEAEDFAWSVPLARGTVAHKAIELSIHWRREPEPLVLVDESISRLSEGIDGLADWLQQCTEVERAELRAEANDRVVKFLECFPPLRPGWRPATESRLRLEIHDRFVLSGKVDLALGQADGDRAGKVLIDLKTGGFAPQHLDDLRFYALLEAVRLGTPPRRLATYYLDQGRFLPEDVSENLLFSTVARVADGITRVLELSTGSRPPNVVPGPACRWCVALGDCEEGRRHLADDTDDDGSDW
ncbi:MAG: PD-(D/E)XK nuclease family protein [Acidimicrobiales bacterium]